MQTMYLDYEKLEVYGSWDVVVVGGGMAGTAAGMAAGKRGFKTLIIDTNGALGGLVTLGLVNIPLDYSCGLGEEMLRELEKLDAHWHRNTDPEKHKLVLDRMVKKYNCDLLLVSTVIDTIMEGNEVKGVIVTSKTGPKVIWAKRVIDCSGDSDAAFYAGAETVCGRPGDHMSQACSLEFVLSGVDWDKYLASDVKKKDAKWIGLIKEGLASGDLPYEVDNHLNWITHIPGRPQHCGMDEVSICFAHSRRCFPTDNWDLTRMYTEGREQVAFLTKFIRKFVPGFENCWLSYTGALMGVRESRRVIGEYVLTASNIAHNDRFDDVIAISAHGYDIHNYEAPGNIKWAKMEIVGKDAYVICNPGGYGTTTPPPDGNEVVNVKGQTYENAEFDPVNFYDIPYRCIVPVKTDSLLVAGRNISTDVEAQSGIRLILTCFNLGQVAGTAAAMSLEQGIQPRALDVHQLQRQLVSDGVNIGQKLRHIDGISEGEVSAEKEQNTSFQNPEHRYYSKKSEESYKKL